MRKCKVIEEVVAMEATAAAADGQEEEEEEEEGLRMTRAAKLKKRKPMEGELSFSSSLVQLKYRRQITSVVENSTSPAASENSNGPLSSPSSDHALASCCSSDNSSQLAKQNFKIIDLQEEEAISVEIDTTATYDIERTAERRKTATSREFQAEPPELESVTAPRPSEANSRRRLTEVKMMPSDSELEDFFSTAEKDLQKQFAKKYNFDVAKEEPLEGRYEWIRVKP